MLALLHAPPGHGKSQLIECLRSYFETVWDWEYGVQFIILAPMNTMAINVGGDTMHAWGEISFCVEGTQVGRKSQAEAADLSSMYVESEGPRYIIIDEVENACLEKHVHQGRGKKLCS